MKKPTPFTHADFAYHLGRIGRLVSGVQADLGHGMWNPNYCSDECHAWAASICADLRTHLDAIEERISKGKMTAPQENPSENPS